MSTTLPSMPGSGSQWRRRMLGMTWNPLGMIPPRSELHVTGYLVPATEQAA